MIKVTMTIAKELFKDRTFFKYAAWVLMGLSFSISVILSTVGIMDGFDKTLRESLRGADGDIFFFSDGGFFNLDKRITGILGEVNVDQYTGYIQSEGFGIYNDQSKGVIVKGVDLESFNKVTSLKLRLIKNNVAIGSELAKQMGVKVGDQFVLAMANGNKNFAGLPVLHTFTVSQLVTHGIYQKDLRIVYIEKDRLQDILGVGNQINVIATTLSLKEGEDRHQMITTMRKKLLFLLGEGFKVRPFWHEFKVIIEAVQIEKYVIGLILQLLVIISIFNVLAFLVFINEKKARELFLFKALGLGQKRFSVIWFSLLSILWFFSCVVSVIFVKIFNWLLGNLSLFQLPGEVYHLKALSIELNLGAYFWVFFFSLLWLALISSYGIWRMKKKPILYGLRKEFM